MKLWAAASGAEAIEAFACFGGDCAVLVNGYGPAGSAEQAAARARLRPEGRPAHRPLDPATGRPAFTGIVQVTAIAPGATEAEALAKAALLSGLDHTERWLRHGGLVVYDDGSFDFGDPHEPGDERRTMRGDPHPTLQTLQVWVMR